FRILIVAEPVGYTEVHEIENRRDFEPLHLRHDQIREFPVKVSWSAMHAVVRQPIAKHLETEFAYDRKILTPALVVSAFRQQVTPHAPVVDGRIRALDARGEHEIAGITCGQTGAVGT